jgi:uncharacterized membrane protein
MAILWSFFFTEHLAAHFHLSRRLRPNKDMAATRDEQLMDLVNILGVVIFSLIIVYHYVTAKPLVAKTASSRL